jgi:putative hydrolases of HD superfamily
MKIDSKAGNPIELLSGKNTSPFIQAYFELCQLKQLYRQGWLRRGIPPQRCESVAEHSFGAAVLALWLAQAYFPELDLHKVVCMALLHDFGEIYTGDIIPSDPVSPDEKQQREAQSVVQVFTKLPEGQAYIRLWEEFEAGNSPEAQFIRQIDRLEMGLQAGVYAQQGSNRMGEFFASARRALTDARLVELMETVEKL